MPTRPSLIPLAALVITGATAFWAQEYLTHKVPLAAYRYPGAVVVLYVFFLFIAFADKRRAEQLYEVGLLRPLYDGAFIVCTHAHLLELGKELGWLLPSASIRIGALSWAVLLIGKHAPAQPGGMPGRLVQALAPAPARAQFCTRLIVTGALGVLGTFIGVAQFAWLLVPLAITLLLARRPAGGPA